MGNLIYVYSNTSKTIGIEKKIDQQCRILSVKNRLNVNREKFIFVVREMLKAEKVYLRESLYTSFIFLLLAPYLKKKFIAVELNRLFGNNLGRRSKILLRLRNYLSEKVYRSSDRLICVTSEIANSLPANLRMKAVFVPNVYCYEFQENEKIMSEEKEYDILFVGNSNQKWQNPELIKSFSAKYGLSVLHIGEGKFNSPAIHDIGVIENKEELKKMMQKCSVALSQLGLARIGMTEAYPLKHAELVSYGIPIISGAVDNVLKISPAYKYLDNPIETELWKAYKEIKGKEHNVTELVILVDHYKEIFIGSLR